MKNLKSVYLGLLLLGLSIPSMAQYVAPQLENEDSWSMVLLPDPQSYVKFERNQPLFELMTRWIKGNKEKLNIELVLCTGDLVEQNHIEEGDGINGDQNSREQWKAVRKALAVLDTVVPYIVCSGNHDYGVKNAENRYTQLPAYFPLSEMELTRELLVDMMPNASGAKTIENAYYEFKSPHGKDYLIMSMEFNPRDTIVRQAKEIMSREEYKDHRGIVLTHSYMKGINQGSALIEKEGYALKDVNHGKQVWEQLIAPSENIEMVLCGHWGGLEDSKDNVAYRVAPNAAGKQVHQMLFNAQTEGGGWHGNGGDGWLRILEFMPDGKTVKVKTFSPLFALSPSTQEQAWRRADYDEYTIELSKR